MVFRWTMTVDIRQPQTSRQAIPFLWSGVGGCKSRTVAKMSGAVVAKAPQFPVRGATMMEKVIVDVRTLGN